MPVNRIINVKSLIFQNVLVLVCKTWHQTLNKLLSPENMISVYRNDMKCLLAYNVINSGGLKPVLQYSVCSEHFDNFEIRLKKDYFLIQIVHFEFWQFCDYIAVYV